MPAFGERQTTCLLWEQGDCHAILGNSDMVTLSAASEETTNSSAVGALLKKAKHGEKEPLGQLLQLYRNYLTILATTQLDRKLRQPMNPSDLVQEAMLAAHCDFVKFRGSTEREFLVWLRQILINCLHHAFDTHVRAKMRDVRREISVEQANAALDRSAVGFAQILEDQGPSPSAPMQQRERAVAFADQLAKLRPQYRDVIVLRNLQGLSFEEVADRMNLKPGNVRMLWLRAIDKLKQVYEPID
jgi:RNA polymerase sigma-70 factor, ECF subfamily